MLTKKKKRLLKPLVKQRSPKAVLRQNSCVLPHTPLEVAASYFGS